LAPAFLPALSGLKSLQIKNWCILVESYRHILSSINGCRQSFIMIHAMISS